jgi:hypothetical protein
MKRFTTILAAATLFVGAAAFASDAWKDKPFESWDEKDVQKIMNDSPWAKKIQFGTNGVGGAAPVFSATGDAAHNDQSMSGVGGSGGDAGGPRNRNGNAGPSGDPGLGRESTFVARWASARVMRQAQARMAVLNGKSPEEATKTLAAQPDTYQIVLIGTDLRAFARADEAALKQSTYLELKKSHEKLTPSRVQVIKAGNGNGMPAAILFEFSKKSASGEPAIAADEKSADFVTMAGTSKLKFGFDFSKMADKQGADI